MTCTHHWVLGTGAAVVLGVCKHCGSVREFVNIAADDLSSQASRQRGGQHGGKMGRKKPQAHQYIHLDGSRERRTG